MKSMSDVTLVLLAVLFLLIISKAIDYRFKLKAQQIEAQTRSALAAEERKRLEILIKAMRSAGASAHDEPSNNGDG